MSEQAAPEQDEAPLPPDYNYRAFIVSAESYGVAAFTVAAGPYLHHPAPIGMLAAHCMELSLKAVLLKRGAGPEDLRRHGHNLRRLLSATKLDWSDLDKKAVDFFADAAAEHAFRYINMNNYFLIGDGHAPLELCEQVFHRCLQEVMPGAQRSLRRTK